MDFTQVLVGLMDPRNDVRREAERLYNQGVEQDLEQVRRNCAV